MELLNSKDGSWAVKLEDPVRHRAQSVAFSHDGRLLANAVSWEVSIWNSGSGVEFSSFSPPETGASTDFADSLSFSPDDTRLAGTDETASSVYVWRVSDSKLIRKFRISPKPNVDSDVLFSPDGNLIAVGSVDPAKVFSLAPAARGASAQVCEIPEPPTGKIDPVAFTPSHDLWLNSPTGFDKWSCASGKPPQRIIEGKTPFAKVIQLKDGSFVGLSKIDQGKLTLTDAESAKQIAVISLLAR